MPGLINWKCNKSEKLRLQVNMARLRSIWNRAYVYIIIVHNKYFNGIVIKIKENNIIIVWYSKSTSYFKTFENLYFKIIIIFKAYGDQNWRKYNSFIGKSIPSLETLHDCHNKIFPNPCNASKTPISCLKNYGTLLARDL